jgi:hypothetical protein
MYLHLIDTYVKDLAEKIHLLHTIETGPCSITKPTGPSNGVILCFTKQMIAFSTVKCISFFGSFCTIFWLKKHGLMSSLSFRNELSAAMKGCTATLHADSTPN